MPLLALQYLLTQSAAGFYSLVAAFLWMPIGGFPAQLKIKSWLSQSRCHVPTDIAGAARGF